MPFSFFQRRRSILESGILDGMTDVHSHLLPGVDDGSPSVEKSLEALEYCEKQGVDRMWFTPHIFQEHPANNAGYLNGRFGDFINQYKGDISIRLGAEYMIDAGFEKHIAEGLLTLDRTHALLETSYMSPPIGFEDVLYRVHMEGYDIILAHPERYLYMDMGQYVRLKKSGVRLQLNLLSLAGTYGPAARDKAFKLLAAGMYDLLGSDIHRLSLHNHEYKKRALDKEQIREIERLKTPSFFDYE